MRSQTRLQTGLILAAGATAALHVGKLAPAVASLQASLNISLVQAGFLLSVVQVAGMLGGALFGSLADGLGHRRSIVFGLLLLAAASAAGGVAPSLPALLFLRALEGFGFLLVVLSAPALLRTVVPPQELQRVLGLWGAYMPAATAAALLLGPGVMSLAAAYTTATWRPWWDLLAVWTATMAWVFARSVARPLPADTASPERAGPAQGARPPTPLGPSAPSPPSPPSSSTAATLAALRNGVTRLRQTLASPGAWCVALAFACYSAQWLAVIGFLPTIYLQAGWGAAPTAFATAAVAAVNIIGNVKAGGWLQRGVPPVRLLRWGYSAMALAAVIAFSSWSALPLPLPLRLLAVALFSMGGGLIPATLFTQAVRHAPTPQAVGTTIGWVQQGSASGQFFGPPIVAWVATANGGWQFTGLSVAVLGLLGLALTLWLARLNAAVETRQRP